MNATEKDLDTDITRCILHHPEFTRAEVAAATKTSSSTVQRKLAVWEKSGYLTRQYALGPENEYFSARALIGVKLQTGELNGGVFEYRDQRGLVCFIKWGLVQHDDFKKIMTDIILERVEQVFGSDFELIIIVSALNSVALAAFVANIVRNLPGITATHTFSIVSYSSHQMNKK